MVTRRLLAVALVVSVAATTAAAFTTRTYYLAAEEVEWDYTPQGGDRCYDQGSHAWHDVERLPGTWKKAIYREYTDSTFTVPKNRSDKEEHLGFLGPVIRAEVGDTLHVLLLNRLPFTVNIEPSGVNFPVPWDVAPGNTSGYEWSVPPEAAPPAGDGPGTQLWLYRSTSDIVGHTQAGLTGPLVIARPGGLTSSGGPVDADREVFLLMQVTNEGASPFADANLEARSQEEVEELGEEGVEEAVQKMAINGYRACNMPVVSLALGERVRWYVGALGSEDAIHVAHWHGIVLDHQGHNLDQILVQGSELHTLDSKVDNADHMLGGMMSLYNVTGDTKEAATAARRQLDGTVRDYFVSVEQEEWDYVPLGGDMCTGALTNFTEDQAVWTEAGEGKLGNRVQKAVYVEFTDASFTKKKGRAPEWEHLGINGPLLRGTVGDTLRVTLRNNLPAHTVSLHPHGVWYDKASEGAPYADGTAVEQKLDDYVDPGATHTYTWLVPERAGPGPADPSSVVWLYHSHVSEAADPYAGLFGPIIITRAGAAREDGSPNDVDRELVLTFQVINENASFLLADNLRRYLGIGANASEASSSNATAAHRPYRGGDDDDDDVRPGHRRDNATHTPGDHAGGEQRAEGAAQRPHAQLDAQVERIMAALSAPKAEALLEDGDFEESNLKHSINGYLYCNLPGLNLVQGERVRLHYMALGGTADVHSPMAPTAAVVLDGKRRQSVRLLAGSMVTTDFTPTVLGPGIVQCAVADHIIAGMSALYTVSAPEGSEARAQAASGGAVREYWIAAEVVDWDYAPLGKDGCTGEPFTQDQQVYTTTTNTTMGAVYRKAVYRGYTDASHTTSTHLDFYGLLGPMLRAEEGDTLLVHFTNKLPFPAGLQPFGGLQPRSGAAEAAAGVGDGAAARRRVARRALRDAETVHEEAEEGEEAYPSLVSSTILTEGGAVAPGESVTLKWVVTEEMAPGPADGDLVAYSYSSQVDPVGHANAGLFGPMVVYRRGTMPPLQPNIKGYSEMPDLGPEIPLLFNVQDESSSTLLQDSIAFQVSAAAAADHPQTIEFEMDHDDFAESNMMHAINGFVYCTAPAPRLPLGSNATFVVMGFGSENGMHAPIFTGQTVRWGGRHVYAPGLLPSTATVVEVTATKAGAWRVYCNILDHLAAGMVGRLDVW